MGIFFTWIILSFIVGFIGSDRKIGFGGAFFISLIFSPLIGLIFTLISKTNAEEKYRESVLETQRSQQESLKKLSESKVTQKNSIADEIEKLQSLKNNNIISEEEFVRLKNKIIDTNINYEEDNIDISENKETITTINENKKNSPHHENPNLKQKSNSFTVFYIVSGIIIFLIIILNTCENNSSNNFTNTDSEITVDTLATISTTNIETNDIEENILKNFSYEDVARYTIASVMGQPSSIIKAFKKDELYYVSYVIKSDSQKFDYKVKINGNQIVWAGIEKGQRWRDSEYDEKISFAEKENKLNIITTYSDGSEGIEEFKQGD